MTSTPADTVRAYAEARINTLNEAIAPLMGEKNAWQRVLQFLPTAGVSPELQERLGDLAQKNPSLRAHLQPLLKEEPVLAEVTTMKSFLTPYRREILEAMPEDFSRQDVLDWVRAHRDDYSTTPGAQVSRAGDALGAFKRYHLVRDYRGGFTKRLQG